MVGVLEGVTLGLALGVPEGVLLGVLVGVSDGVSLGVLVGLLVGVGVDEEVALGEAVGLLEGVLVGVVDGVLVGLGRARSPPCLGCSRLELGRGAQGKVQCSFRAMGNHPPTSPWHWVSQKAIEPTYTYRHCRLWSLRPMVTKQGGG